MTELAVSGFWFLLGFFLASWLAWRAQLKQRARLAQSFQAAKKEVLRLLDSMKDLAEIRVTIRDEAGVLIVESQAKPAKDLH